MAHQQGSTGGNFLPEAGAGGCAGAMPEAGISMNIDFFEEKKTTNLHGF